MPSAATCPSWLPSLSLSPKHCQNLYQEAVRTMKAELLSRKLQKQHSCC